MSRLTRLMGKPMECKLGEETLTIRPLGIDELDVVFDLEKDENEKNADVANKKRIAAVQKLVFKTLKASVPDATDEEIRSIKIEYLKDIISTILKVNGLIPEGVDMETYAKAMAEKNVNQGQNK